MHYICSKISCVTESYNYVYLNMSIFGPSVCHLHRHTDFAWIKQHLQCRDWQGSLTGDWKVWQHDRRRRWEKIYKDWWIRKGAVTWHWTDMMSAASEDSIWTGFKGVVRMIFSVTFHKMTGFYRVVHQFQWLKHYLACCWAMSLSTCSTKACLK